MKLGYVVLAAVAMSFLPRDASSVVFKRPSIGQALHGAAPTLPAAWAGIWTYQDTTHTCADPSTVTGTDSGLDTLCTGQGFEPDSSLFTINCTGTVDDNSGDITCTGSGEIFTGCNVQYTAHFVATRSGNQATVTTTVSFVYTPDMCAFQENSCDVTKSRLVRIAPEPATCTTPTLKSTWGAVKVHYR